MYGAARCQLIDGREEESGWLYATPECSASCADNSVLVAAVRQVLLVASAAADCVLRAISRASGLCGLREQRQCSGKDRCRHAAHDGGVAHWTADRVVRLVLAFE